MNEYCFYARFDNGFDDNFYFKSSLNLEDVFPVAVAHAKVELGCSYPLVELKFIYNSVEVEKC